jgi:hypothetical protein
MVKVSANIVICTAIAVFAPTQDLSAKDSHQTEGRHRVAKQESKSAQGSANSAPPEVHLLYEGVANLACRVPIKPNENREIIIMKLQQRMDCMEVKLNHLNSMMERVIGNENLSTPKN